MDLSFLPVADPTNLHTRGTHWDRSDQPNGTLYRVSIGLPFRDVKFSPPWVHPVNARPLWGFIEDDGPRRKDQPTVEAECFYHPIWSHGRLVKAPNEDLYPAFFYTHPSIKCGKRRLSLITHWLVDAHTKDAILDSCWGCRRMNEGNRCNMLGKRIAVATRERSPFVLPSMSSQHFDELYPLGRGMIPTPPPSSASLSSNSDRSWSEDDSDSGGHDGHEDSVHEYRTHELAGSQRANRSRQSDGSVLVRRRPQQHVTPSRAKSIPDMRTRSQRRKALFIDSDDEVKPLDLEIARVPSPAADGEIRFLGQRTTIVPRRRATQVPTTDIRVQQRLSSTLPSTARTRGASLQSAIDID